MLYHFLKSKGILESLTHGEIIDIGSGDGYVGKEFEDNGFEVTYIEKKNGLDATVYEYPSDYFGLAIARNSLPFMGNKQFDVISNIYKYKWIVRSYIMFYLRMKELLSVGEVAEELMVDSLINKDQWNSFKIQKMYSEYYIKIRQYFVVSVRRKKAK